MKFLLGTVILLLLSFILVLPLYLGPDDIATCEAPSDTGVCAEADAIVVVSGGDTNARTDEGIQLFMNGWAPVLLFSGAAADPNGPSNAEAMRQRAIEQGVPRHAIKIEELSRTTTENAENTSKYVESDGIDRLILVTSPYHQRRANLEFRSFIGETTQIINHPVSQDKQWQQIWWLNTESVYLALSEVVKILLFYLRGPVGL